MSTLSLDTALQYSPKACPNNTKFALKDSILMASASDSNILEPPPSLIAVKRVTRGPAAVAVSVNKSVSTLSLDTALQYSANACPNNTKFDENNARSMFSPNALNMPLLLLIVVKSSTSGFAAFADMDTAAGFNLYFSIVFEYIHSPLPKGTNDTPKEPKSLFPTIKEIKPPTLGSSFAKLTKAFPAIAEAVIAGAFMSFIAP